jgi:hypothetical protein
MTASTQATDTARAITRRLEQRGPWMAHAELRRAVKYKHRGKFDAAVTELITTGALIAQATQRGTRYRLTDPPRLRNQDRPCQRCGTRKRRPTGPHCGHCLARLAHQPNKEGTTHG